MSCLWEITLESEDGGTEGQKDRPVENGHGNSWDYFWSFFLTRQKFYGKMYCFFCRHSLRPNLI